VDVRSTLPREKSSSFRGIEGSVGRRTGLDVVEKGNFFIIGIRSPNRPASSLVALPTALLRLPILHFRDHFIELTRSQCLSEVQNIKDELRDVRDIRKTNVDLNILRYDTVRIGLQMPPFPVSVVSYIY
jgi:hypothetical protein